MKAMATLEKCAFDEVNERQLFMVELENPDEMLTDVGIDSHFACLIAWDASNASTEQVVAITQPLIDAGCVYFCCWGPDCERVHDIIDESDPYVDAVIMTTWHSGETLEEAVWFLINTVWPDKQFEDTFKASIGISIGSKSWASLIRGALSDPSGFTTMILNKEDTEKTWNGLLTPLIRLKELFKKR